MEAPLALRSGNGSRKGHEAPTIEGRFLLRVSATDMITILSTECSLRRLWPAMPPLSR